MEKEKVKNMVCEAIENIPDCAEVADVYVEHSFGDSVAWIKIKIKVKEETDENITDFHNIAHNSFNTDLDLMS